MFICVTESLKTITPNKQNKTMPAIQLRTDGHVQRHMYKISLLLRKLKEVNILEWCYFILINAFILKMS
jgi:hypothetical protein